MFQLSYTVRKYHAGEPFIDWVFLMVMDEHSADGVRGRCRLCRWCDEGLATVWWGLGGAVGVQGAGERG